jgi:3-hydroxypropanoate dehydrogenase
MTNRLSQLALEQLFLEARTHNKWQDKKVSPMLIKELVNLLKWGPTSANCQPVRFVFALSREAREKLAGFAIENNREKIVEAPACAIIAHDLDFLKRLPELFPHADARSWFEGNDRLIEETAFRNGSLQGAYFILACRALGLDTGPMSGFDNEAVDREYFAGTNVKSNFLCCFGHGDPAGLFPRSPRPSFADLARII